MSNVPQQNKILRASILIAASSYVSYATGLIGSILIARVLGPSDYGKYAYLIWLVGVFVSVANNGLPVSAIKFVAEAVGSQKFDLASAYLKKLKRLKFISIAVALPIAAIYAYHEIPDSWGMSVSFIACYLIISAAFKSEYVFNISIAKGYGFFTVESKSVFFVSIANIIAIVVAWKIGLSIQSMLMINCAASVGYWVCSKILLKVNNTPPAPLHKNESTRITHHLLWSIALTVVGQLNETAVNIFALNKFSTSADVGVYSVAANLTKAGIDLFIVGFSGILMSSLGHAYGRGGAAELAQTYQRVIKNLHFFGLLVAGGGALISKFAILTLYGEKYVESISIMQVMFVVCGITLTDGVFTALLGTIDRQKERVFITGGALIASAPISYFLTEHFGMIGAVMGYTATRLVVFIFTAICSTRLSSIGIPLRSMLHMTLIMVVCLTIPVVMIYCSDNYFMHVPAAMIFVLSFAAACIHQKIWSKDELTELKEFARKMPLISKLF